MGRIGGIVLFLLPRARYEYHLLLIDRETDYYMNYIYNIIITIIISVLTAL